MKEFFLSSLMLFVVMCGGTLSAGAFTGGEHWNADAADTVGVSGTMPVLYVNTENGVDIDQKIEYIPATYWLDASATPEFESVGSAEAMLPLGIRGRGNATWQMDKKPYKMKLDKKASLLGMNKNKHWALLAFLGGDGAYFGSVLGMEMGRDIMQCWTPRFQPVEVVLNGQYIGLYFLAETVRIDDTRLNIAEQPEGNEDAETANYGYLVELDNYDDENQITFVRPDGLDIRFTVKTPEPFTVVQEDFVRQSFQDIVARIFDEDRFSQSVDSVVDMESFARHYVVQELMHNIDGYAGSCYWYLDQPGDKWRLGPLWDIGDSADDTQGFQYEYYSNAPTIITQMIRCPAFIERVQGVWNEFRKIDVEKYHKFLNDWAQRIQVAENQNMRVWTYWSDYPIQARLDYIRRYLDGRVQWLDSQWNKPLTSHATVENLTPEMGTVTVGGHDAKDMPVFRNAPISLEINPAEGYELTSLQVNGTEMSDAVSDNKISLTVPDHDMHIRAEFDDGSGVNDICADTSDGLRISGQTVESDSPFTVYNAAGGAVALDVTRVRLSTPGVYVVKTESGAQRVSIR